MNKNLIFFADNGLTSTSANHIANLAKEYTLKIKSTLENVNFYNKSFNLIDSDKSEEMIKGDTIETLNNIPNLLLELSEANSLIAWLREAIKAREELTRYFNQLSLKEYCIEKNLIYPTSIIKDSYLTEDKYYGSLTVKERNRYYWLETQVATIGKYIHKEGDFSEARKKLEDVLKNPITISENGRDTIIYKFSPSVTMDEVEEIFFKLQNQHREYQSELNAIKFKCETAINKSIAEIDAKYTLDLVKYNSELKSLSEEFSTFIKNEKVRISNLKIIIPNDLNDIYQKITKLGK